MRLFAAVMVAAFLAPAWLCANTGGAIHVPSGRFYVRSGSKSVGDLQNDALAACQQKEGVSGDATSMKQCMPMENFTSGACDSKTGKGNQSVTVGGYQAEGGLIGFTGFLYCGKSQTESDQGFQDHCAAADGCTIWRHYQDTNNQ